MFEIELKKYYDTITPSNETRAALLAKIRRLRKKRATYKLVFECFASAAACFLLAVIINYTEVSGATALPDKWIGAVLSKPNGYLIGGMLLAILIIAFVVLYRKKITRYIDKKHKDINE